ncbi:uncharacterized protein BO96DRAFT_436839 [Aspergillus niger CBS 101883]|uniref:Uncharacterized protein n=2 Tax=Aspergillus niger TaxID=5061 RepID=A2QY85_ASPNC|nr:uncharacterized protein BO96DRAFT_436839 [Aspergillus niger CBS 101883]XP_059601743.1 hypothetical protein An12g00360 [Aspergillus niger]PYH53543.1 hypothetical protein BO96DRAFT_436839 [Aspergillus niger CBS 101883]CAK40965.1 hypothetical protein An12g00360 [Aspergillus niger]
MTSGQTGNSNREYDMFCVDMYCPLPHSLNNTQISVAGTQNRMQTAWNEDLYDAKRIIAGEGGYLWPNWEIRYDFGRYTFIMKIEPGGRAASDAGIPIAESQDTGDGDPKAIR